MTEGTTKKKVAIVGKAPASLHRCPWDDHSVEIWGLSDGYRMMPEGRWNRWFELHDVEWHRRNHPEHWQFLKTDHGNPLYLLSPHEDVPHAQIFPRDKIAKRFPIPEFFGNYFTNSISWFIALALVEGFEWIGLYGVDMAQHEEYAWQRPSCEYWIGVANGLGVTIEIPGESDLMKCRRLYGYETHSGEMYVKCRARDAELKERKAVAEQSKAEAEKQAAAYEGAIRLLEELSSELNGDYAPRLQLKLSELQSRRNQCAAIARENDRLICVMQGAIEGMIWTKEWA